MIIKVEFLGMSLPSAEEDQHSTPGHPYLQHMLWVYLLQDIML